MKVYWILTITKTFCELLKFYLFYTNVIFVTQFILLLKFLYITNYLNFIEFMNVVHGCVWFILIGSKI